MAPRKGSGSMDTLEGAVVIVTANDLSKVLPGDMEHRIYVGDHLLCLKKIKAKLYRYVPIRCRDNWIQLYPNAYEFDGAPIETRANWQPLPDEFHLLRAHVVLHGEHGQPHPLRREMLERRQPVNRLQAAFDILLPDMAQEAH